MWSITIFPLISGASATTFTTELAMTLHHFRKQEGQNQTWLFFSQYSLCTVFLKKSYLFIEESVRVATFRAARGKQTGCLVIRDQNLQLGGVTQQSESVRDMLDEDLLGHSWVMGQFISIPLLHLLPWWRQLSECLSPTPLLLIRVGAGTD